MPKREEPAVTADQASAPDSPPFQPEPASQDSFPLSLDEWCALTSQTDRRVEMLWAFRMEEMRLGRGKDMPDAYSQRFAAFAQRPVS